MAPGTFWLDRVGRVVVPSDNDKCVVSSTREPEEGCGVAFDQVGRAIGPGLVLHGMREERWWLLPPSNAVCVVFNMRRCGWEP